MIERQSHDHQPWYHYRNHNEVGPPVNKLLEFKSELKSKALEEIRDLWDIYQDVARRFPEPAEMYPWDVAKRIMKRVRRTRFPDEPDTLEKLDCLFKTGLLNRYQISNELLYKNSVRDNQGNLSIIFVYHSLIDLVMELNPSEMHVDTTFKVVSHVPESKQLLSVHFIVGVFSLPVIYCLMEDDTFSTYYEVFSYIKHHVLPSYHPNSIISDLDTSLKNVLNHYFIPSKIQGNWFQHNQDIRNKIDEYGYLDTINQDPCALKCCKMLMTLPLLPPNKIITGFIVIQAFMNNNVDGCRLPKLFEHYERHWLNEIGTMNYSVYKKPQKTNDNIETFHKTLKAKDANKNVPPIYAFLDKIQRLSEKCTKVAEMLLEDKLPRKYFRYQFDYTTLKISKCIRRLDSGETSISEFLLVYSELLNRSDRYFKENHLVSENEEDSDS